MPSLFFCAERLGPCESGRGPRTSRMSRRWAQLHNEDGSVSKISIATARSWLESGDVTAVRDKPLIVTPVRHRDFDEEQRHLSGRKVPGVHKGIFNGKYSVSSGVRTRPPRSSVNWDYVKTIGLVREFERNREDMLDDERDDVTREQAAKRRKDRKRRKRARKGDNRRRG